VIDGESLRARLGQLARERRLGGPEEAASERARASRRSWLHDPPDSAAAAPELELESVRIDDGVETYLPGGEWLDDRGRVWIHERLRSDVERRRPHWGRLGVPPEEELDLAALAAAGLERALFLDLETGGLASSPVFLAGTMHWNGEDFVLRQYFARHYGEEATLIAALNEAAKGFEFLVTFNGKSYDAPFLKGRAFTHGVPLALPPYHVDLLHPSRRRWSGRFRDCRLQTLEMHVCRRRRAGDVPSEEVPGLYHDFVRRGDPYRLVPVFHHNLLDVITMGELLRALCGPDRRRARGEIEVEASFDTPLGPLL
jgi:uncharacterized protein YprB with RNaseH-like and TPR domain